MSSSTCGGVTERYKAPAARELPELRSKLGRWLAGTGPRFYLANFLIGRQWLPGGAPADTAAAVIAGHERQRVMAGELYWVSAAMTDLARHAAGSLPSWNLYRHDVPSSLGLMVFEAPIAVYRNDEGRGVEIVAASWGPWSGPEDAWRGGGLWLTFYSHPAPVLPPGAFSTAGAMIWTGRCSRIRCCRPSFPITRLAGRSANSTSCPAAWPAQPPSGR